MTCNKYECRMRGIERDRASDKAMKLETKNYRLRMALSFCLEHANANEPLSIDTVKFIKQILVED